MKVVSVMKEALHEVVLSMSYSPRCRGLLVPMYYKQNQGYKKFAYICVNHLASIQSLFINAEGIEVKLFLFKCYSKGSKHANFSADKYVGYLFCKVYSVPVSIRLFFCKK